MNRSDKVTSDFLAPILVLKITKETCQRKSVKTLGSMYAITIKQNINTAMFGFVKKQTCISKNTSCSIQSPQRLYRFNIKFVFYLKVFKLRAEE